MIEIGEYVRNKNGKIDKVINNNYYIQLYIECEKGLIDRSYIVKHSKNIIDLIEEGDYVNGDRMDIVERNENGEIYYLQNADLPSVDLKNIESILTKEQYAQNCYKVKE